MHKNADIKNRDELAEGYDETNSDLDEERREMRRLETIQAWFLLGIGMLFIQILLWLYNVNRF